MPRVRDRSRRHDVVLFGATGFTGRLVAEYLVPRAAGLGLRWALGGRDREKLEALRRELATIDARAADLPILVADVRDPSSLAAIARDTEVVCTTVGPYAKYGTPLVEACVEHGTDYCDLTGEVTWIRRMVDAFHDRARTSGARIVHCCGFDSIPSDLGVHLLQSHAVAEHGAPCGRARLYVGKSRGGVSGGTIASMMGIADEVKRDPGVRKVLFDPYALHPEGERHGPHAPDPRGVAWDDEAQAWTCPFVMGAINSRVVRRTNALDGWPYGRDFVYDEVMAFPRGAKGAAIATGVTAGLVGFLAAAALGPTRALLERTVLPKPGEGPSRETRERGCFELRLLGHGVDPDGRPFRVEARVEGKSDPGYGETAKMLAESATCLALDGPSLDVEGGILTPAHTMGDRLVDRLRKAGMVFDAHDAV